jgi:hypothetical protein
VKWILIISILEILVEQLVWYLAVDDYLEKISKSGLDTLFQIMNVAGYAYTC